MKESELRRAAVIDGIEEENGEGSFATEIVYYASKMLDRGSSGG